MPHRVLLLVVSLLTLLPADALARAGGGSHSFRSPSSGYRGSGRGFGGGHHFLFFGGGGGGGFLLLIVIALVVLFLVARVRRRRSSS